MKKIYSLLLAILCSLNLWAQDDDNIITIDSPVYEGGLFIHTPKTHLLNPYMQGNIFNIIYSDPENWDVIKRRALEYACKIWEENMQTAYPRINLQVGFQDFGNTLSATRTVVYTYENAIDAPQNLDETTLVPKSIVKRYFNLGKNLCYENINLPNALEQKIDISITFNNNENLFYWNTDGQTEIDKLDFITIALREIAKGLGFCSGIRKRSNLFQVKYNNKVYPLDNLLGLDNYEETSIELANKIQPTSNKLSSTIANVYLYAPSTFVPGVSLNYFDETTAINGEELMKPYIGKGESYHNIGDNLRKMLNKIGWQQSGATSSGGISINNSTKTDKTVDYNENYNFNFPTTRTSPLPSDPDAPNHKPYFNNFSTTIPTGYTLWLLRKDGIFQQFKHAEGTQITFAPKEIPDSENWARSSDGNLRACISYYNLEYLRFSYMYIDYLPEKPELDMTLPQTLTRSLPDKIRLGYKANAAQEVTLLHETEDGITEYDLDPNLSTFDFRLIDLDETVENYFTIYSSNKNGRKTSQTVVYGGEAFLAKKYGITTNLELTDQNDFIKAELVSTNGFGYDVDNIDYTKNITHVQISNVNNSSIIYLNKCNDKTILIPASNLNKGIYVVNATDNEGKMYNAKFTR